MPREFVTSSGLPEDPRWVRGIEKAGRQMHEKERTNDKEFEEILSSIDFSELKRIFEELYARSGGPPGQMNFVPAENIFLKESVINKNARREEVGEYENLFNLMHVSRTKVRKWWPQKKLRRLAFLHMIIHEEVHAMSHLRVEGLRKGVEENHHSRDRIGYQVHEHKTGSLFSKKSEDIYQFALFNEGAAEHLARRVLKEYLDRDKDFARKKDKEAYEKSLTSPKGVSAYPIPIRLLEEVVRTMSSFVGVDQEVVWRGIHRGMIEGQNLLDKEFQKLVSDCLPPGFIKRLANAKTKEEYVDFIRELQSKKIVPPSGIKERLVSWLKTK